MEKSDSAGLNLANCWELYSHGTAKPIVRMLDRQDVCLFEPRSRQKNAQPP